MSKKLLPKEETPNEETTRPVRSVADRLHDLFIERFGDDWRRDLTFTLRADRIFWLVRLAEWGIEARKEQYRRTGRLGPDGGDPLDASVAAANLSSWQIDLEQLPDRIESVIAPISARKPRSKS